MMILMTIALVIGIALLIIGFMLIVDPNTLYKFNKIIIKIIYQILDYLNKKLLAFNSYFNNLIFSQNSVAVYRLAIGAFYLIVGIGLIYTSYYYSQQGALPPMIQGFFNNLFSHFQTPAAA